MQYRRPKPLTGRRCCARRPAPAVWVKAGSSLLKVTSIANNATAATAPTIHPASDSRRPKRSSPSEPADSVARTQPHAVGRALRAAPHFRPCRHSGDYRFRDRENSSPPPGFGTARFALHRQALRCAPTPRKIRAMRTLLAVPAPGDSSGAPFDRRTHGLHARDESEVDRDRVLFLPAVDSRAIYHRVALRAAGPVGI